MEWLAYVDACIETTSTTETREDFYVYNNPLVQMPPAMDTTFHFLMEGQPSSSDWTVNHPPDETIEEEYVPNAPFWRTSLGQTIAKYKTSTIEPYILAPLRTRLENAPSNEEFFQESIEYLCRLHVHVEDLKNAE